jgi:hypothetical protein
MRDPRYGQLIVTREYPLGPVRILHADPVILISHELLEELRANPAPGVEVEVVHEVEHDGEVLRITPATGGPLVYQVGPLLPDLGAHVGMWPD